MAITDLNQATLLDDVRHMIALYQEREAAEPGLFTALLEQLAGFEQFAQAFFSAYEEEAVGSQTPEHIRWQALHIVAKL